MNLIFMTAYLPDCLIEETGYDGEDLYMVSQYLIKGFKNDKNLNLDIVTSPDIPRFPRFPKLFVRRLRDIKECLYVTSVFNVPYLRQIWRISEMFIITNKILKNKEGYTTVLIPYMTFTHVFTLSLLKLRWGRKIKTSIIIPDIFFASKKQLVKSFLLVLTEKLVKKIDSFVLYTKSMVDYLGLQRKPYIIMEGIIDDELYNSGNHISDYKQEEQFIVLYTGSLHSGHYIERLFEMMEDERLKNVELWITGKGSLEDYISRKQEKDSRIKYLGLLSKKEVFIIQQKASILINPRISLQNDNAAKFMFPSKIMEYMLSGNPSIVSKMDGIPEEYYQYLIVPNDSTGKCLADSVYKIMNMSIGERVSIGLKAKEFIMQKKNYKIQSERIVNLLRSEYEK